MIFSKYSGDSHSPRYESMRRTADFVSSSRTPGTLGGTTRLKGSREKSGLDWASPELRPMEVWMHRRKGDVWMTIRKRFLLFTCLSFWLVRRGCSSARACSRMLAIWWPTWRAWRRPPYVRGGSYGVGELRCHFLSAASRRLPCLGSKLSVNQCEQYRGKALT